MSVPAQPDTLRNGDHCPSIWLILARGTTGWRPEVDGYSLAPRDSFPGGFSGWAFRDRPGSDLTMTGRRKELVLGMLWPARRACLRRLICATSAPNSVPAAPCHIGRPTRLAVDGR